MGLYDFTLYDVIVRNALLFKNKTAWQDADNGDARTFGQIRQEVDQLASALRRAGCKKGDRIAVAARNCRPFFILYGAAAALGAIVLPVNWRLSADEAVYVLKDGSPRWVFDDNSNEQWTDAVRSGMGGAVPLFNLVPGQGPFDDLEMPSDGSGFTPAGVTGDDGFVIIYTAAVTGSPRGALLSQGNLLCSHMHLMQGMAITPEDVHLNALPLFHVAGLFMSFCAFHAGCKTINLAKFDPAKIVRLIPRHKVSVMFTFAPMLNAILEAGARDSADISALRAVMGLDAPDVVEQYQKQSGGTFYCLYGQTETAMVASMAPYDEAPGSAGRPILLGDVQLMNESGRPVPVGEVGEIALRGPMVFKGYWGLEADTEQTFRNAWHHTGDLGRMDEAGYLWYAGRKADKELIKPGGENVYPAEVEKAVLEHPDVEDVVVFGVPDPKWKEGIKAVCVLGKGAALEPRELIAFVGERIARYKKPQYVEFVEALPRSPQGEVDRDAVKKQYGG